MRESLISEKKEKKETMFKLAVVVVLFQGSNSAVYFNEVLTDLPTSSKFGLMISECRDLEAVEDWKRIINPLIRTTVDTNNIFLLVEARARWRTNSLRYVEVSRRNK